MKTKKIPCWLIKEIGIFCSFVEVRGQRGKLITVIFELGRRGFSACSVSSHVGLERPLIAVAKN